MIDTVTGSQTQKWILVVEDDQSTQEMMLLHLRGNGYEVVIAGSGSNALDLAKSRRFDLCILDSWLKEGDGIELCQQIRAFDSDTPIVFYSGAAYHTDIEKAMAAGAQAYLVKPYLDSLKEAIDRLIEHPTAH